MEQQAYRAAIEWVLEAGTLVRNMLANQIHVRSKASHSDLVTEIDLKVEQLLVQYIRKHYPDHAILGEESVDPGNPDGVYMWIIDPIDGTTNLINRKKEFAISVALCGPEGGVFGLIYDVMNDLLYRSFKGEGAFVNEAGLEPLSDESKLSDELVALTLPWERLRTDEELKMYVPLIVRARGIRYYGASTMELCDLAKGLVGAYVQHAVNAWDFAAGRVLLEELGCKFTNLQGESIPWTYRGGVVAAAPGVHAEIIECLRSQAAE